MGTSTRLDPVVVEQVAKDLYALFGEPSMDIFDNAKTRAATLNAGKFDAAQWIEDRVLDRTLGIYQHALDMQFACRELSVRLSNIVKAFQSADRDGAGKLTAKGEAAIVGEVNAWITGVKGHVIPPAKGAQVGADNDYDSDDDAPSDHHLRYGLDNTGAAVVTDGKIPITMPKPGSVVNLPSNVDELIQGVYSGLPNPHDPYDGGSFTTVTTEPLLLDPNAPKQYQVPTAP